MENLPWFHGSENNRSFIGLCPLASVSIDHGTAIFRLPDGTREERPITQEYPVEKALEDFLGRFHVEGEYANYCGLYGYTSFNAVRYFENIPVKDSREATNDAPDMLYILYQYLIVFNDFKNEMVLLEMLAPGEESELDTVQKAINNRNYTAYDFRAVGETTSPLTDEQHKANIRQGIAHCLRGDVFQIVLSRRFEQRFVGDDFKLYRALRSINPSIANIFYSLSVYLRFISRSIHRSNYINLSKVIPETETIQGRGTPSCPYEHQYYERNSNFPHRCREYLKNIEVACASATQKNMLQIRRSHIFFIQEYLKNPSLTEEYSNRAAISGFLLTKLVQSSPKVPGYKSKCSGVICG